MLDFEVWIFCKDFLKFVSEVPILETVRNLNLKFQKLNVVDFKGETPCP
jgi:hypothetical protein